jgi:colanic acid/amylovoran biosynthesis glycosyltransferase
MPNVLIYTNSLLPASETFIRNPALQFERYTPYFVGSLREAGLDLPEDRLLVANGAGLWGRVQQRLWLELTQDFGLNRLVPRLRKLQPQILQAHYGHSAAYALPLVQTLKIPFVVYYHGLDATTTEAQMAKSRYMRRYLQRREILKEEAELFLAQSDFLKNCLIAQGFPAEKIRRHYIGTEISKEMPLALEERENIILFVARLTKKKGGEYLIDAMKLVQEKYPEMQLVIVGDGPARNRWEDYAREHLSNYRFIGWQNPEQVAGWMKKARVFCVPSVQAPSGDSEGFGMVFVEAQRWGTPVASFAHGGIVEAVADGKTGLLAPERDSLALARNILQLLDDEELWRRFSLAAYERVKAEFDVKVLAGRLEEIYDELLEKKKTAPD